MLENKGFNKIYRQIGAIATFGKPTIRYFEEAIKAPNFTVPRVNGNGVFSLREAFYGTTLICFWKAKNYMSQAAILHLDKWYRENDFGRFNVLAINCDDFKPEFSLYAEQAMDIVELWDKNEEARTLYAIEHFPSAVLIDPNGMVRDEMRGGPVNDWSRLYQRVVGIVDE